MAANYAVEEAMTDSAQTMTRRCQWCREICRGECGCDAEKRIAAIEADIEKRRKWNTELARANDRLEVQCREEIRLRSEAVARAIAAEKLAKGLREPTDEMFYAFKAEWDRLQRRSIDHFISFISAHKAMTAELAKEHPK